MRLGRPPLRHLAVATGLLVLVGVRLGSPDLDRPFEVDELLTVRYYTWAGVRPTGDERELHHIADFYRLGPPGARHLAMGGYCGLGRWPEPNNHVVNSLLVNGSLAVGRRDERWARVPALLGAVAFAAALYYLLAAVLGWRRSAPLAVVWAWFAPYVVEYSQTARGYTWMLALQVILIAVAYALARRPGSLALGALGALTAVLCLMNVVSMAVDWLLPFYAALLLVRPAPPGGDGPPAGWRKPVAAQALAVAGMGAIFFVSHLPSLYSSARQYGLEFHSAGEFAAVAYHVFDGLFPDVAARGLAGVGAVGLVALVADRRHRFLATLVVLVLAVNLAHVLAAGRFPYPRAAGHFLPLALLGAAYLVERVTGVFERPVFRAVVFGVAAAVTVAAAVPSWGRSLHNEELAECLAAARRAEPLAGHQTYVPVRAPTDYLAGMYAPEAWRRVDVVKPGMRLAVVLFDRADGGCRLRRLSGPTGPLLPDGPAGASWVFWYPDFAALGVDAREPAEFVRRSGLDVLPQYARSQVKMDVYGHLQCFLFFADDAGEHGRVVGAVRSGLDRFGGRAVVFAPERVEVVD